VSIEKRKEREGLRLRERILAAALRVFAEQGYEKVSMRRIAARIDYSPTTIYRFFRNKEDLLGAMAAGTMRGLAARFAAVQAEGGGDPLLALRSLVREYALFCLENPEMFRLFSVIADFEMEGGVMYERLGGNRYPVYTSWLTCIRQCAAAGRLAAGDEIRVLLFLWDAVNGYIIHRIRHPRVPRKPAAEDIEDCLDLIFGGIESRPNAVSARRSK
jgi:AcrR family transcriptional regulator